MRDPFSGAFMTDPHVLQAKKHSWLLKPGASGEVDEVRAITVVTWVTWVFGNGIDLHAFLKTLGTRPAIHSPRNGTETPCYNLLESRVLQFNSIQFNSTKSENLD
jgi:hypothetical protein